MHELEGAMILPSDVVRVTFRDLKLIEANAELACISGVRQ
jgi:hypothetical protein